jgi:hypothetical protein
MHYRVYTFPVFLSCFWTTVSGKIGCAPVDENKILSQATPPLLQHRSCPGVTSEFPSFRSLQAAGRQCASILSFILSSFEIASPESGDSTESDKLVDGSRTNSISLRNTGTAVSRIKDRVAALSGPVLKQRATNNCWTDSTTKKWEVCVELTRETAPKGVECGTTAKTGWYDVGENSHIQLTRTVISGASDINPGKNQLLLCQINPICVKNSRSNHRLRHNILLANIFSVALNRHNYMCYIICVNILHTHVDSTRVICTVTVILCTTIINMVCLWEFCRCVGSISWKPYCRSYGVVEVLLGLLLAVNAIKKCSWICNHWAKDFPRADGWIWTRIFVLWNPTIYDDSPILGSFLRHFRSKPKVSLGYTYMYFIWSLSKLFSNKNFIHISCIYHAP